MFWNRVEGIRVGKMQAIILANVDKYLPNGHLEDMAWLKVWVGSEVIYKFFPYPLPIKNPIKI